MKQYLDLLEELVNHGQESTDRTGVGTYRKAGHMMRFDLSQGLPIVTTKKIHLKSVIHELLWVLGGHTTNHYLQRNGVTIWDSWQRPWYKDRDLIRVNEILKPYVPYDGDFGFRGVNAEKNSVDGKLAAAWVHMMKRCYDPTHHNYKYYGEKGVSVCKEWHDPSVFIEQVKLIPHWKYKLSSWNDFELDKDYFNAKQYGPDTCIWLHKTENIHSEWLYIRSPEGDEFYVDGFNNASNLVGISKSTLHRFIHEGLPTILKGNNKKFNGWEIAFAATHEGLIRKSLISDGDLGPIYGKQFRDFAGVDQIQNAIDLLRTKPDDRGIIVTAWNPVDLPYMALRPCHCLFQLIVINGKLNLEIYQRSADAFLGTPFNIAFYALMTHMFAQQANLEVGELIWIGGDVHLYKNHVEQAVTQLCRTPMQLPHLVLNKAPDMFSYKYEDFKIVGYNCHPAIKAPVAV